MLVTHIDCLIRPDSALSAFETNTRTGSAAELVPAIQTQDPCPPQAIPPRTSTRIGASQQSSTAWYFKAQRKPLHMLT